MTQLPEQRHDAAAFCPHPQDLARLASAADTSVIVVTADGDDERRAGCLVGFHTHASISPWRYLVLLSMANHTHRVATATSHLAVHLLAARSNAKLAELFGATTTDDGVDKFSMCRWQPSPYGPPLLDDAAGWLVGAIVNRLVVGDHEAFVLDPVALRLPDTLPPMLRYSDVRHLQPGHEANQ